MKIAISSAEHSGDAIGAELIQALKTDDIEIQGLIGDKMQNAGAEMLWNMERVNVMGFTEVLKKILPIFKLQKEIINYFSQNKPDIFIGIDAPDFNFKIERKLKKQRVKTIHFVSPSVWAWRENRVKKIKKSTDLVLCLFPFEVGFYKKHNQKAVFVGHPLAQKLTPRTNHIKARKVLLMPGSRESEVKRLLPEMLLAVEKIKNIKTHIVLANDELLDWVKSKTNICISTKDANKQMLDTDLAIVASGTASLELALVGVPMVVIYKMSAFSYFIASMLVKSKYVSLPNIITNKNLVPELIQKQANADNIADNANKILNSDNTDLINDFKKIHTMLNVSDKNEIAKIIMNFAYE